MGKVERSLRLIVVDLGGATAVGMLRLGTLAGMMVLVARISVSGVSIQSGFASKGKFGNSALRLGLQKLIPK